MSGCFRRRFLPALLLSLSGIEHTACAAQEDASSAALCPHRPTHSAPLAANAADYPLLSIALNEQGYVVLDFRINRDGSVADVKIAKSSGFARLDGAATDVARQRWRFDPVLVDGKPVSCRHRVGVTWRLDQTPEQLAQSGFTIVHMGASDYPSGSQARGERGASVIMAVVDPAGKILQAQVSQSSGFADLDAAAIGAVKSGRWPVVPPQVSGKPVSAMIGLVVIWPPSGQ